MYGQFSFLALNKIADWERGQGENLVLDKEGISLMNEPKYGLSRTVLQAETGITEPITNLCSGPFGLLFLLDAAANIWTYDFINHQTTLLLKAGHGLFSARAGLTIANNTLFLLDYSPNAIIAISATNGQILWISNEFYGGSPLTAVVNNSEDLLVITYRENTPTIQVNKEQASTGIQMAVLKVAADGRSRIWSVPSSFCLIESADCLIGERIKAALNNEEQLYVLDSLNGQLWIFAPDGNLVDDQKLRLIAPARGLGIDSEGAVYTAVIPDNQPLAADDRCILKFSAREQEATTWVDIQGYVVQLWLDRHQRIYVWNRSDCSLSILEKQASIRLDSSGKPRGIYLFPVMDSTTPEMEWHRISLQAFIPDDTQIRLSYFSSDSKEQLIDGQLRNIELLLQDINISLTEKLEITHRLWSQELVNPRDMLMQGARGRYLWLKVELIGSESRTPRLRSIRIYYPRMSLLSYLPAVYQEDAASQDFLERFLSLFGSFLQGMEEQIDQVSRILDPEVVSGPFLSWLGSWLDLSVDENWSEQQVRQLLIAAPSLYKKRGTREGMEDIIAIYTGEKPLIVEYFQYKYLQETQEIKEIMSSLYDQNPYGFTVLVKQERVPTSAQLVTLQRIIDEEKPAFTEAKLVILQPWMYMDMHSYLGINTYLSELSLLRLDNKSSMPFSSVIIDRERDNRFDTHSRMELDAHLK